jgi:hypothetical protein
VPEAPTRRGCRATRIGCVRTNSAGGTRWKHGEHVPPNTAQFEYCVSASPRTAEVISTLSQGGGNPSPNGSKPGWHIDFDALAREDLPCGY